MRSDVKGEQEGEHTTQLVTVNLSLLTTVDETQVGAAFSDWINNKSLHILLRWTQNLYEQKNFFRNCLPCQRVQCASHGDLLKG